MTKSNLMKGFTWLTGTVCQETKAGTWGSHLETGTEAETSREVLTAVHTFPGMLS